MRLYPLSEEIQKTMEGLDAAFRDAPFWQVIAIIAIVPAICEELAFRGFILSGFRHGGTKWRAILYSALLFGLTHSILQQSLIAALVGVVLGYLAVQTGSIVPGMVFHFVHNTLAATSVPVSQYVTAHWPLFGRFLQPEAADAMVFRWPVVVVASLLAAMLLVWFARLGRSAKRDGDGRCACPA